MLLADAIREQAPEVIVVDDAHVRLNLVGLLRRLRLEIGAGYRIHANCWPSTEGIVASAMEIGPTQIRTLGRMSRKRMASLIESLGVGGPDVLIKLLLDQSAGKPGLCAALVEACKRDGAERVWTGEVLAEHLLGGRRLLRDEVDHELLARFALGGKQGVAASKVAGRLGISLSNLRARVASLGAGGIIIEVDEGTLAITPSTLDGVLIRDVFYAGLVRPDIGSALADCASSQASTHVLIGAAQRGASVDRQLIRSRVANEGARDLWEHYAYLDEQAARDIILNFANRVCDAGEGLLAQLPAEALPALILADQRNLISNDGDARHPRQLIRYWVSPWEQEEKSGSRRALLLDALEALSGSGELDGELLVKYAAEWLDPRVHGHRTSPVERNTVLIRRGVHAEETLREIANSWPRMLGLLPVSHTRSWSRFYDVLSDWAWPARGGESVGNARSTFMHDTARKIAADLQQKFSHDRVHLHKIRWINSNANLGLTVPEPDGAARLFEERLHTDPWLIGFEQRDVELKALAADMVSMGADAACEVLGDVERDFNTGLIHGGYDRYRLYSFIAEVVDDPTAWLNALTKHNFAAQFAAPMLNRITVRQATRLQPALAHLLADERYRETAIQNVIHTPDPAGHLVDVVIRELKPLEKDN